MSRFHLKPHRILAYLVGIAIVLAILSLISEYLVVVVLAPESDSIRVLFLDLFSVNLEESIPTWFSVVQLFVAAALFGLVAYAKYQEAAADRHYWAGLSALFLYLSMDEGAAIHEIAADPIQAMFDTSGFFAFGWQIVAFPILIVLGLIYLRFFLRLDSPTRNRLLLAATVYIGGALIIEGFSAALYDANDGVSMPYLFVATIEETAEMIGVALVIYTLCQVIVSNGYSYQLNAETSQNDRTLSPEKAKSIPTKSLSVWVVGLIALLILSNIVAFIWQTGDEPINLVAIELPFYYSIQVDLDATDSLVLEIPDAFSINSGLSRQIARDLLDHYAQVTIVALPEQNQSIVFAGDNLPVETATLTELLHSNGITGFVIFETDAVRVFTSTLDG